MKTFVREKTIYCGDNYREVDIFNYTHNQKITANRKKRACRTRESAPKQKNLNDKNAWRYFNQLANLNFGEGDMFLSPTYDNDHLPASAEEAERIIRNYLRRIRYARKKKGLSDLKYMLVTAYDEGKSFRVHHHIILNGGIDRDTLEEMWSERKKKGQNVGDKIGINNSNRLQPNDSAISGLCGYIKKHTNRKKRWSSSQNLKKPESLPKDNRYSKREVERIVKSQEGREFWEAKYPGWTLTDDVYGVTYEYSEVSGWAIYLKMRRKDKKGARL